MRPGQESGFRMSGSGNMQRKAMTAGCIPGAIVGTMQSCRRWIRDELYGDTIRSMLIPREPAYSTARIWSGTFGSGPTNSATHILAQQPCAVEVITSRKDRYGTFRRGIDWTST